MLLYSYVSLLKAALDFKLFRVTFQCICTWPLLGEEEECIVAFLLIVIVMIVFPEQTSTVKS